MASPPDTLCGGTTSASSPPPTALEAPRASTALTSASALPRPCLAPCRAASHLCPPTGRGPLAGHALA